MRSDLDKIKNIYVIGIKGSGIIGVVEILHSMGANITGSDTSEKFFTDEILDRLGIEYFEKFDPKNITRDIDLVIYSTAYNEENNIEFKEAVRRNFPMISYPEVLAQIFNDKYGIAVCGTHGKTTTSSWLANTLKEAGADPTALVGSKVVSWGGNALYGQGKYCVLEADEYQNKLKLYNPKAAVLLSCDFDHPDYFEDFSAYKEVFKEFVSRIPREGFLVVWGDSTDTLEISESARCNVITYGFTDDCDLMISKNEPKKIAAKFRGKDLGEFSVKLIGDHNLLNAAAVIAACYKLGLDLEKIREALPKFSGTSRRFEYIGQKNGAILIDDYGHHPEEIKSTLKAAREIYPEKNIWAVFHPHTFSRTKALLSEFAQSFDDADKVIILDIYGSARETQGGVHSKDLVELVNKFERGKAEYIATINEAADYLKSRVGADDVVLTIGAGNVWEVADKLAKS